MKTNLKYLFISRCYAKAIFELAHEKGLINKVLEELSILSNSFAEFPNFSLFLDSREESYVTKKDFISKFSDKLGLSSIVKNTLFLLIDKRHVFALHSIFQEYVGINELFCRMMRIDVTVSRPEYSDEVRKNLEKFFKDSFKKDILCNVKIDSEIIGGVLLRIGDTVIDRTIRGKLEKMKQEMING